MQKPRKLFLLPGRGAYKNMGQYFSSAEAFAANIETSETPALKMQSFLATGRELSQEQPILPKGQVVGRIDPTFAAEVIRDRSFDGIHALVSGRVAALQFKNIASKDWCDALTRSFIAHPEIHRESVTPAIYTLGKHLYACGSGTTIKCYFEQLPDTNRIMKSILPNQEDRLITFLKEMAEANGLDFEYLQAGGNQVEHGTLRLWGRKNGATNNGTTASSGSSLTFFANPHEDLKETSSDHPMLKQINNCDNIYGVILCIQAVPGKEPRTVLWDKELDLSTIRDSRNRFESGSYGFSTKLLED